MATKPSSKLNWVNSDDPTKIAEPTTLKKNTGWEADEKPPFQWFNWLFNIIHKWNNYFEATTDELISDVDLLTDAVEDLDSGKADASALTSHVSNTSTHGVSGAILGSSDPQVITNKDIDGGAAANTRRITVPKGNSAALAALTRKQGTVLYDTTLLKLLVDDGTNLQQVGTSSSGINLISSPNDAGAWAASGAGVTVATSTTAAELPLAGVIASAIKITAVSGSDYARIRWTMPSALFNMKLGVNWYQLVESGYAHGDFKVDVYTNSASNYGGSYTRKSLSSDSSSVTSIPNGNGQFGAGNVVAFDSGSELYYELRVTRVSGTKYITLANVTVGPGQTGAVSALSGNQGYTPDSGVTQGLGTLANNSLQWRQVGSNLHLSGRIQLGTVSASEARLALPNLYTIGSFAGNSITAVVGKWARNVSSATTPKHGVVLAVTGNNYLQFSIDDYTGTINPGAAQNANAIFANSNFLYFDGEIVIPIAGWESGTLNIGPGAQVEYAYNSGTWDADDTSSFAAGYSGAALGGALTAARTKRVQFQTPIQPSDEIVIEISEDRNKWFPISAGTLNGNAVVPSMSSAASIGTSAGAFISTLGLASNQVNVLFARYMHIANDDSPAQDWPSSNAFWRVRKCKPSSPVGFGMADENNSGLISTITQVFAGEKTFTTGIKVSNAAGQSRLDYYEEGTFTANFNQGASTNTNNVTVTYRRIGKMVFLEFPQVNNITMNVGGAAISTASNTIPASLLPQRNVEVTIRCRNNGSADAVGTYGTCDVQTGRVIEIIRSSAWSAATSNCGWTPFTISYTVA